MTNICADCSTPDPKWASINRGVLVCDECCSVHRILGRHISYIRSLQSTNWPPVLKEMVLTLVNKGSNTIWEHALHEAHSKVKIKKPGPRDKLHPNKHDFIVAKYKHLLLLPRLYVKDNPNYMEDLSKQLHASVRTGNLDTCLRLLSLGANPNYTHPDRGNTPLHVASQAGQAMQVELLTVHGANPCTLDRLGHTPEECARIAGHHQLADRLIECQYELTDKLSFFLCGRKPVHSIGEHHLVPQVSGSGLNLGFSEARSKLQELSNELFEELAMDIYDEVDRRETDSIWLMTQQLSSSVAFLPVNPTLSPLRNQGRQKLATLNAEEFAQLVVDLLIDTKRRQTISFETGQTSGTMVPSTSEDRSEAEVLHDPHDYDEVPVEEMAMASRPPMPVPAPSDVYSEVYSKLEARDIPKLYSEPLEHHGQSIPGKSDGVVREKRRTSAQNRSSEYRLTQVLAEKAALAEANDELQRRIEDMQKQLNKVIEENVKLRAALQQSSTHATVTPTSPSLFPPLPPLTEQKEEKTEQKETETEEEAQPQHIYAQVDKSKKLRKSSAPLLSQTTPFPTVSSPSPTTMTGPTSPYTLPTKKSKSSASSDAVTPPPARQDTPLSDSPFEEPSEVLSGASPSLEVIHLHTKNITQCIQELLQAAQTQRQSSFPPCSLKICKAVEAMVKVFPPKPSSPQVQVSLREVHQAAKRLQDQCRDSGHSTDLAFRTRHIINSAYDVAKAVRQLIISVEQEKKGER